MPIIPKSRPANQWCRKLSEPRRSPRRLHDLALRSIPYLVRTSGTNVSMAWTTPFVAVWSHDVTGTPLNVTPSSLSNETSQLSRFNSGPEKGKVFSKIPLQHRTPVIQTWFPQTCTFEKTRDQGLGHQVSRPKPWKNSRPRPWSPGLETRTKTWAIWSQDQDENLDHQVSRPKPRP